MELAAYIYDAWAYEQANQGSTDLKMLTCDEFCDDKNQVNDLDWNFVTIKRQAYLLSAIALTSLNGLAGNLAPAVSAHLLEPSVNVAPWCENLYICSTSYILEVQTLLAKRGFVVGEIDGVYGRYTKQAVIDFQRTQTNLVADGIPGQKTLDLLRNSAARLPLVPQSQNQSTISDRPTQIIANQPITNQQIVIVRPDNYQVINSQQPELNEVGNLQVLLKQRGFYEREIDGQLGRSTTIAILQAQQAYGLGRDGFVGPLTMRSLLAGGNNIPLIQPAFTRSPTPQEVLAAQTLLKERGFYGSDLNGQYNVRTRESILKAQLAYGQEATGDLSSDLLTALKAQNNGLSNDTNIVQNIPNNQNIQPMLSSPNNAQLGNSPQAPASSQNAPLPPAKSSNSS
ncbi:MAG: peptidoglycan-binding protein [Pseudanabaena sp. CAN_BIN31]|nr:peptidoglycan-binding protein [Pseudanabaena sp. CAN_BIN31]